MELDAFTAALGKRQGRVRAPGESGAHLLVLGDVEARRARNLTVGDYVEWSQDVELRADEVVRIRGTMSTPDVPPGLAWELSIMIDGRKAARLLAAPGRTQRLDDMVALATDALGSREVALRLELVSVNG